MANVPSATRNGSIKVVKGVPIADCSIRKNVFLWRISCLFKRQRKSKERLLLVRYFDHDDKGKETRLDDSVLDFVLNKFYVVLEYGLFKKTSFGISRKFRNHIGPAMILWKTHFPRDFRLCALSTLEHYRRSDFATKLRGIIIYPVARCRIQLLPNHLIMIEKMIPGTRYCDIMIRLHRFIHHQSITRNIE
jgi:hypothetical protein